MSWVHRVKIQDGPGMPGALDQYARTDTGRDVKFNMTLFPTLREIYLNIVAQH